MTDGLKAMFSKETIEEIEKVAQEEGIDPAALLAIAEVESGGRAFAYVGGRKEPLIRFEGHYFDRLLSDDKREKARRAGLASPKAGQIKNARSQAERWGLLNKAMGIDRTAALQSVSWGIGQVMGTHFKTLGYGSVEAMVQEARSSIAGQMRLMMRFIRKNGLAVYIERLDWAGFARRYNGPAYKKNSYDTRIAAAYARHSNGRLKRGIFERIRSGTFKYNLRAFSLNNDVEAVRSLQHMLTAAGYAVQSDGIFGVETDRALRQFQAQEKLVVDGIFGPQSRARLKQILPRLGRFSSILAIIMRILRLMR